MFSRTSSLRVGLALMTACALILSACEDVPTPTEGPAPVLVTLPAASPPPVTPSAQAASPTALPTESIPPTPAPQSQGIGATHLLWEWPETSRPSALAVTPSRLAAIVADGRFAWLNAATGQVTATAFLWTGLLQGDSWGEIYTDSVLALVAIREQSINPKTGLADSRARLAVYDGQAHELWSLPELGPLHFYSAAMASGPGIVVVGKWPHSFEDNQLAAYELFTGKPLWHASDKNTGYQQVIEDGTRVYVLLDNPTGGGVAAYDLRTGDKLWQWSDPAVRQPDQIALGDGALYVMSAAETLALDSSSGTQRWAVDLNAAPEAGLGVRGDLVYLAPAPSAQTSFRPGVVGLKAASGELAWHTLGGLVADPVAASGDALWAVVKDYDGGQVYLSGLDPETGLERIRLPVSRNIQAIYQLVALDQRVYVLGDSLLAYGY
jgi:outer membrane protein assembly factor BamB